MLKAKAKKLYFSTMLSDGTANIAPNGIGIALDWPFMNCQGTDWFPPRLWVPLLACDTSASGPWDVWTHEMTVVSSLNG